MRYASTTLTLYAPVFVCDGPCADTEATGRVVSIDQGSARPDDVPKGAMWTASSQLPAGWGAMHTAKGKVVLCPDCLIKAQAAMAAFEPAAPVP